MSEISTADAQAILAANFAPWVLDLGLTVEHAGPDGARLRMAYSDRLTREGGVICGQALMALADTTMVLVVSGAEGGFRPMTTVSQTTNFLKPVSGADVIAHGVATRLGRSMAFGDIRLYPDGGDAPIAHIATAYALLPK